jgi:hypothetical protein
LLRLIHHFLLLRLFRRNRHSLMALEDPQLLNLIRLFRLLHLIHLFPIRLEVLLLRLFRLHRPSPLVLGLLSRLMFH